MSKLTEKHTTASEFIIPPSVVSKIDVAHLVNELEEVDSNLSQAAVRTKAGGKKASQPTLSENLTAFLEKNGLDIGKAAERSKVIEQLRKLKEGLPVLHMTFAVSADGESLRQLADWVRTNIDPQAVIDVGLQPALVAGVYLRTTNHVHDFSVRGVLAGRHELLVKELEALHGAK